MKWNPITRRQFLQGSGSVLMLPLLESLLPRAVWAEAIAARQKTFVGIAAFNGLFRMYGPTSELMPQTPTNDAGIINYNYLDLPGKHRIHHKSLSSIAAQNGGRISKMLDEKYTPYLDKMLLLQGLDYMSISSAHHHSHFGNQGKTTNGTDRARPMASIDQVMAYSSSFYKNPSLVGRSVAYSTLWADQEGVSFTFENPLDRINSPIVRKPHTYSPWMIWDAYFGTLAPKSGVKKSLVDGVLEDFNNLKNNPRLGSEDKQKLERHIAFIFDAQKTVAATGDLCSYTAPGIIFKDPAYVGKPPENPINPDNHIEIMKAMNSLIASLAACGLCHSFAGWAGTLKARSQNDWHNWSHIGYDDKTDTTPDPAVYADFVQHNQNILDHMCLDLVKKLDAVGELEHSLIVWNQEHSKRGHSSHNVPMILFGGASGSLKMGQYLDFRNFTSTTYWNDIVNPRPGFPMNQAWANILRAMDVPPSEYEAYNKADETNPIFATGSGYGAAVFRGDYRHHSFNYKAGWNGHDLSSWLPLIKV